MTRSVKIIVVFCVALFLIFAGMTIGGAVVVDMTDMTTLGGALITLGVLGMIIVVPGSGYVLYSLVE